MEEALPLRDRMNLQTARITWAELQRQFAGGRVIHVSPELDLVEVATCMAADNAGQLRVWLEAQLLQPLTDETAKQWVAQDPQNLWAVVVAPWALVQQRD